MKSANIWKRGNKQVKPITTIFLLVIGFLASLSAAPGQDRAKIKVEDKVSAKAYPFDLKDVRLLEGPFRDAMLRDQQYLLSLDLDRLLHNFRVTAGLPSSAKPLGGWEALGVEGTPGSELRGHSTG